MESSNNKYHLVYYGNSPLLNKLKYYPIALLLIIILFGAVVYNFIVLPKWLPKTNFGSEWQKKQHIKLERHFLH